MAAIGEVQERSRKGTRPTAGIGCRAIAAIAAGVFVVLSSPAAAQPDIRRVDARRLSCDAVQAIIAREGAVILRSRSPYSGRLLWERYVYHRGFCFPNEITEPRFVSSRDTDRCWVKLCRERPNRRDWLFRD